MTVATGSKCIGGIVLYADRNVVAADLSRAEACKIYGKHLPHGSVALASATEDAIVAEVLGCAALYVYGRPSA